MVGCFRWEEEEVVIKFEEMVDGESRTLYYTLNYWALGGIGVTIGDTPSNNSENLKEHSILC